jgi:hypothetical protein
LAWKFSEFANGKSNRKVHNFRVIGLFHQIMSWRYAL